MHAPQVDREADQALTRGEQLDPMDLFSLGGLGGAAGGERQREKEEGLAHVSLWVAGHGERQKERRSESGCR